MKYGKVVTDRMFVREYHEQLDNAILGIMGEAGEIADHFKKLRFHPPAGRPSATDLRKELGDLLWYLAALNQLYFGDSLLDVAQDNIKKLQGRYPDRYNDVQIEELSL